MKATLDRLVTKVNGRFSRLRDLESRFGFLLQVDNIVFASMEDDELGLQEKCNDIARCYANNIDSIEQYKEIKDCQMLFRRRSEMNIAEPKSPVDLLHLIISCGDDVFPNLRISLQILSTIGSSIASCERSFSKLKLILTYLRATMSQTR